MFWTKTTQGIMFTATPAENWQGVELRWDIQDKEAFCAVIGKVEGVEKFKPGYPSDTSRYGYDLRKGSSFTWKEVLPGVTKAIVDYRGGA